MFGVDSETLNFAQLPVGYPAALPFMVSVPEPSAAGILVVSLAGLACLSAAASVRTRGRQQIARRRGFAAAR